MTSPIPMSVEREVSSAIAKIKLFNAEVLRLRALEARIGNKGRYEAECRESCEAEIKQKLLVISNFRAIAKEKGLELEAEKLLKELGLEAPLEVSQDCLAWQHG